MQTALERKRASWLTRDPIVSKDGEITSIEPRDLLQADIDTLLLAHEFYLSPDFAGPLTGRTEENARRRFRQLKRGERNYLDIASAQKAKPNRFWNDEKYCVLSGFGYDTLKEKDIPLPLRYPRSSSFDHDVLSHQDILSARIAAKRHWAVIDLIQPDEILETLPPKTARNKAWYHLPLSSPMQGQNTIWPDYFPLGVERKFDPDVPIFFALELETGTNHIPRTNYEHSNLGFKVLAWLDVLKNDTYYKHLGLPTLYIAFSVLDANRFGGMHDMISELVPPKYQKFYLWKQHPSFAEPMPKFPTYREQKAWQRQKEKEKCARLGYFLEGDFQRVGGTFNFLTSKE